MEGSLWDRFVTGAPRSSQRGATGLSPLARARRQSCNTAIRWLASVCLQTLRSASFARGTEQRTGHQPQDGREVAQACDGRGYEDRAEGAAVDSFERRGRGGVIPPFLTGCTCRTYAAIFSFIAGVMPPMPMLGRSLL